MFGYDFDLFQQTLIMDDRSISHSSYDDDDDDRKKSVFFDKSHEREEKRV